MIINNYGKYTSVGTSKFIIIQLLRTHFLICVIRMEYSHPSYPAGKESSGTCLSENTG